MALIVHSESRSFVSTSCGMQTGSCSAIIPGQEAFRIDREAQEESVSLVADITDASIRAALLGNRDSAKYLTEQLPKNARVLKAETNAMCYQN